MGNLTSPRFASLLSSLPRLSTIGSIMPAPRKSTGRKKTSTKKSVGSGSARGKKKPTTRGGAKKSSKKGGGRGSKSRTIGPVRATKKKKARRGAAPPPPAISTGPQRLQKVLAAAGVASRRECEQLVLEGRVEVDREVVTKLGTRVDPDQQKIRVDGVMLKNTRRVYFAVNKPTGVVATSRDPAGRPRVIDMIPETSGRVFTVGRLDMASEGLILLTNDGDLANQLAHPRYGIEKTYEVQVAGVADTNVLKELTRGMHLAEAYVKADSARIKRRHKQSTVIEMVLSEGKNREVRRMLARLGHKVQRLKRVAIGTLRMGELPEGHVRKLEPVEVKRLRAAIATKLASAENATSDHTAKSPAKKKASGKAKSGTGSARRKKPAAGHGAKKPKARKPLPILKSPQES